MSQRPTGDGEPEARTAGPGGSGDRPGAPAGRVAGHAAGEGGDGAAAGRAAGARHRTGDPANPAADQGLNPLTSAAAAPWGPEWVHRGEGEGVDTPVPYNPVSNSVGFQQFATHPEEFRDAPQLRRSDPPGAGVVTPSPATPPAPERPRGAGGAQGTGRSRQGEGSGQRETSG